MNLFGATGLGSGFGGYAPTYAAAPTPQSAERDRQPSEPLRVLPVTIAQIYNSHEGGDAVLIDGAQPKWITLVGLLISVDFETGWSLRVDDGTGAIGITVYPDSERIQVLQPQLVAGAWVRVTGHVRSEAGTLGIFALHMELVADFNHILYHHMQVVLAHQRSLRGVLPPAADQGYGAVKDEPVGAPVQPANAAMLETRVLQTIGASPSVTREEIARAVAADTAAVEAVLQRLIQAGRVYSADSYTYCLLNQY